MNEEIMYRLLIEPRVHLSNEEYMKSVSATAKLVGFSQHRRDDDKDLTEFRLRRKGKTQCKIQIKKSSGLAVETTKDGITKSDWKDWSTSIIDSLVPNLGRTKGSDFRLIALVRSYRFPKSNRNNYNFLRDYFLKNSNVFPLIKKYDLFELNVVAYLKLTDAIMLAIAISSNQSRDEIRDNELEDEDNRIIFELHAIRLDITNDEKPTVLIKEQETELEKWLQEMDFLSYIEKVIYGN